MCRGCQVHLKILILHVKMHKVFLPLQLPVRSLIMKELGNKWNEEASCPAEEDAASKTGLPLWEFVVPCASDTGAYS